MGGESLGNIVREGKKGRNHVFRGVTENCLEEFLGKTRDGEMIESSRE